MVPIPLGTVNISDLNVNHLNLDQLSIGPNKYIHQMYGLVWMVSILLLIQTCLMSIITYKSYPRQYLGTRFNKTNEVLLEDG